LDDCRSVPDHWTWAYFVDTKFHQITGAKLAIYRQIEECKIAPHACDLEPNANGPNVFGLDGLFLADEQSLIPRPWMAAADKTNERGGSSANPPAASLYVERNKIAIKYILISI
jgi:hypothetical protein